MVMAAVVVDGTDSPRRCQGDPTISRLHVAVFAPRSARRSPTETSASLCCSFSSFLT